MTALGTYTAGGRVPADLADGRVLAPGETAELDPTQAHNARLIASGRLVETTPVEPEKEPTKAELLEQAKVRDIPGRTTMNVDELAEAIARADSEGESA